MAKVDLSKLFKNLRGRIGGLVFRRMPDGSIVVSGAPTYKKKKGTPAQKAYRHGTFRERTQWAKWAQHEYPIYAQLAAERPMITAYNMAISDAAHPPVIHRVLRREECILIHASDEIMVAGVKVTVHDEQGKLLEVGDASQVDTDWWTYIPQVEGRVSATAWDLPGNQVHMELVE
jgi:hypothetical protein